MSPLAALHVLFHVSLPSLPCTFLRALTHTDWVLVVELELQPVRLARVYGILIEDLDVEEPLLEVVGRDKGYTRRQAGRDLGRW